MSGYYPILLNLRDKSCLVVGGGDVAERKVLGLLQCEASVQVIAKRVTPLIRSLAEEGRVRYSERVFEDQDLVGVFLVITATNDRILNRRVSRLASERGILVNAVDQPEDCSFIVPSVIRRGDLLIALSTSGKSPALARKLREDIEGLFGTEYGAFLDMMGIIRKRVLAMGLSQEENGKIFGALVRSGILTAIRDRDGERVRQELARVLPSGLAEDLDLNGLMTA